MNMNEFKNATQIYNNITSQEAITTQSKAIETLMHLISELLKAELSLTLIEVFLQKFCKAFKSHLIDFNNLQIKEILSQASLKYNLNLLQANHNFIYVNNSLMSYDTNLGIYLEINDTEAIKSLIELNFNLTLKEAKEIIENLKILNHKEYNYLNNYIHSDLVHCKNGMLDISSNEINLVSHNAKYASTSCLNVAFEQEADCPTWKTFLEETFALYVDNKDIAINLLKEFMGYSLIHGNSFQKMLCITGKPRTGKSIIADIIHQILGTENTSSIPFDELNDPNKISALIGKLANINGELPKNKLIDSSKIKSLIGEDILTYKKLYQNPAQFKNQAKLISIGNYLPSFKETTNAMLERMLVLTLDNVVPEEKRDPLLKEKLKNEKNGIFLWCLEGLISLKQRGHFIEPDNSLKSKEAINHLSNSVHYWLDESEGFIFDIENKIISFKNVYQCYKDFCKENGVNAEKRMIFKKTLEDIDYLKVYRNTTLNQDVVELIYIPSEAKE